LRVAGYQCLADAAEPEKEVAARKTAEQRNTVVEMELAELREQYHEGVAGGEAAENRLAVVDAELAELRDNYEQAIVLCNTTEDCVVASEHGHAVLLATIEDDEKTTRS
jgi:hypothetical protein